MDRITLPATAPNASSDVYGVSNSGSKSPETSYLIARLSANDPADGVSGSPLTVEFIDEVNIITGGYIPEYGRTLGGALSGATKSGGNEFHGSVFGTSTPAGNLLLHRAVPRIEMRSPVFFCWPEQ